MTLEEVGGQIGITRERVRQLQGQALRDLRNKMAKYEKQRTLEEIKVEKQQEEKAQLLKDLLHKDIPVLPAIHSLSIWVIRLSCFRLEVTVLLD